jgi:hypothetical protein
MSKKKINSAAYDLTNAIVKRIINQVWMKDIRPRISDIVLS